MIPDLSNYLNLGFSDIHLVLVAKANSVSHWVN